MSSAVFCDSFINLFPALYTHSLLLLILLKCILWASCFTSSNPRHSNYSFSKPNGFPSGSDGKASVCDARDPGSIPGLGRSPGEGNGSRLQYSCLENPMDHGAWQATVHGVTNSRTRLSDFTFHCSPLEFLLNPWYKGQFLEHVCVYERERDKHGKKLSVWLESKTVKV